jgi:hypothetical protein
MKPQDENSDKQSTELCDSWKAELNALNKRLSAYGPTVTVREGSDSSEYKVTFPQARASRAKPQPE